MKRRPGRSMRLPVSPEPQPEPESESRPVISIRGLRQPISATEADHLFRVGKGYHLVEYRAGRLHGVERRGKGRTGRVVMFSVSLLEAHHGLSVC
jgi:hypothetical protein